MSEQLFRNRHVVRRNHQGWLMIRRVTARGDEYTVIHWDEERKKWSTPAWRAGNTWRRLRRFERGGFTLYSLDQIADWCRREAAERRWREIDDAE